MGGTARKDRLDLSVIIVNWNTRDLLRACLASVVQQLAALDHEVIVVDNASDDGSPEMLHAEFPDVKLIRNRENAGFGRANNQAMREASGRWLLLLNSDTMLPDTSVADLIVRVRDDPEIGIAQCQLRFPDGRLQHSVYRFPSLRIAALENLGVYKLLSERTAGEMLLAGYWDYATERDVDWVSGAFMLLPRAVYEQTGGFDERLHMYGEDLEWCLRVRDRGWRIRYYPQATVIHHGHASSDVRWGDERVVISLRNQCDIYRGRHGRLRSFAYLTLGIIGTGLRTAYYGVRRLSGPRAATYAEMHQYTAFALRSLVNLALRDRR